MKSNSSLEPQVHMCLMSDGIDFFSSGIFFQVWHNYGFDRHVLFNKPDGRQEQSIDCKGFGEFSANACRRDRSPRKCFHMPNQSRSFFKLVS